MKTLSNADFEAIRQSVKNDKENVFPYRAIYPTILVEQIDQSYKALGYPTSYMAAAVLVAFAAAIGKSVALRFKTGFVARASLFIAIVGKPNTNKTHPVTAALGPLRELDELIYQEFKEEHRKYVRQLKMAQKAGKEDTFDAEMPRYTPIIAGDITIEELYSLLSRTNRGVLYYVDELAGLIKNMGRYNSGSDMESLLSLWSGSPSSVMRKTSDPLVIGAPVLSLIGTIQPKILPSVFKDKQDNGFMDRIIWIMREEPVTLWYEEDIDARLVAQYSDAVKRLYALTSAGLKDGSTPREIELTPEARQLVMEWHNNDHASELEAASDETYAGALGKMDIIMLRCALIIQCIWWGYDEADNEAVSVRAVQSAIILTDYFKRQAIELHRYLYSGNPLDKLTEKQRRVYDALPNRLITIDRYASKAEELGMNRNVFKKFLANNKVLFVREDRGMYAKKLIE